METKNLNKFYKKLRRYFNNTNTTKHVQQNGLPEILENLLAKTFGSRKQNIDFLKGHNV